MISLVKLVRLARKWQNLVALRRKRIAFPRAAEGGGGAIIGCFVVYTSDGIRFVIPLGYLENNIFQELLKMAEEEYGLQNNGPIKIPMRATFMQYIVSQIEADHQMSREEDLRSTISSWRCLSTSDLQSEQAHTGHLLIC